MLAMLQLGLLATIVTALLTVAAAPGQAPTAGYKAAVYAHRPVIPPGHPVTRAEAVGHMMQNLDIYKQQVEIAGNQGVDIIVFPEDGLYGFTLSRSVITPYLEPIPDPQTTGPWVPCTEPLRVEPSDVLTQLSCMARNNSIYLVANMGDVQQCDVNGVCPPDGHFQYNTDVVFDSTGKLVARYHKRTLFGEKMFDPALTSDLEAERITFDTPFGRFGVFTCLDILFYDPSIELIKQGVRNFVFPTAWMDSYPLLDAVGFHSAWARSHQVNFLAANIQLPEHRFSGSGVYSSSGPLAYYYNKTASNSGGTLLVVDVPGDDGARTRNPDKNVHSPQQRLLLLREKQQHSDQDRIEENENSRCSEQNEMESQKQQQQQHQEQQPDGNWTAKIGNSRLETSAFFENKISRDAFNMTEVNSAAGEVSVCQGSTCCSLQYSRSQFDAGAGLGQGQGQEYFAFGVFQGVHDSQEDWYFKACVLTRCTNSLRSTCGKLTWESNTLFSFNITGHFGCGPAQYIYPEVLVASDGQVALTPPEEWQFHPGGTLKTTTRLSRPLLSATLYVRNHCGDPLLKPRVCLDLTSSSAASSLRLMVLAQSLVVMLHVVVSCVIVG